PYVFSRSFQINATRAYRLSKELVESSESAITLSPDGAVVVCWHPVRKPISHNIKSLRTPTSPLKINVPDTIIKNSAEPTVVELSKAFGVPWFHFRPRRSQKSRSPYFWAPLKERNNL
ncbi:large subunit ribosomal protein L42, partial [Schistosoma bovis]